MFFIVIPENIQGVDVCAECFTDLFHLDAKVKPRTDDDFEKAILKAELGFNPNSDGNVIRIMIPALTEETRKEIVKDVKGVTELARVSIRNLRREANDSLKKSLKDHEVTEDEEKKGLDDIQKLTDDFIKELDLLLEKKEKEILEI